MKNCPLCGAIMKDADLVCPQCGAQYDGPEIGTSNRAGDSRLAADGMTSAPDAEGAASESADNRASRRVSAAAFTRTDERPAESQRPRPSAVVRPAADQPVRGAEMTGEGVSETRVQTNTGENAAAAVRPAADGSIAAAGEVCPSCGASVRPDAKFCPSCEAKTERRYCKNCGYRLEAGRRYCPSCGASVTGQPKPSPYAAGERQPAPAENNGSAFNVKALLATLGNAFTALFAVIFSFLPFASVTVKLFGMSESAAQGGIGGLQVLFTGKSELTELGVSAPLLQLVGAIYLILAVLLVFYILYTISHVMQYDGPLLKSNLGFGVALTLISLLLMILAFVTNSQMIGEEAEMLGDSVSVFNGPVLLFVFMAIMLVYQIVMRAIFDSRLTRRSVTPNLLNKKVRTALVVICVILAVAAGATMIINGIGGGSCNRGGGASKPSSAGEIPSSGSGSITCKNEHTEPLIGTVYYGVVYYKFTVPSDGAFRLTLTPDSSNSSSMTDMLDALVGDYDEVVSAHENGGDDTATDAMRSTGGMAIQATRGDKFSIAFMAMSAKKDTKFSYTFRFEFTSDGTPPQDQAGDSYDNPKALSLNSAATVKAGKEVYFKFTISSAGDYRVTAYRDSGSSFSLDWLRVLRGRNDVVLSYGGGYESRHVLQGQLSNGSYVLQAGAADYDYTVKVEAVDEAGSDSSSAVTLTENETAEFTLKASAPHYFKFTPEKSAYYRIKLVLNNYESDLQANFDVRNAYNDNFISPASISRGNYFSRQTLYLSKDTAYYVRAYMTEGTRQQSASLKLTRGNQTAETEEALSLDESVVLSSTIGGYTSSDAEDYYYFRFSPSSSGTYRMRTIGSSSGGRIRLYEQNDNGAYNEIKSSSNTAAGEQDLTAELTAGTVYRYSFYKYTTSDITVTLSRPGSSPANPITAVANTGYNVTIPGGGKVFYEFTPTLTADYFLSSSSHTGDPNLYVYRYNGDGTVTQIASDENTGGFALVVNFNKNSRYCIEIRNVSNYSSAGCAFTIE